MTKDKVIEVLELYEKQVGGLLKTLRWEENTKLLHVLDMCASTKTFVKEDRLPKAFRWLGFIQGVLWCEGIYTIEEMKRHNMPPEPKNRWDPPEERK